MKRDLTRRQLLLRAAGNRSPSTRRATSAIISTSPRVPACRAGPPSLSRTKLNIDSWVVVCVSSSRARTGRTIDSFPRP